METIKKLDKKYLVLKVEDLDKYFSGFQRGVFATSEEQELIDSIPFKKVLMDIDKQRKSEGKNINNEYVVLNQNDNISLSPLIETLSEIRFHKARELAHSVIDPLPDHLKVKDISIHLVNAILSIAKKDARDSTP